MKISAILDHVDSGHIALPEFQRGYVWKGDQVRGLMDSLFRRHPVGSLLVWVTGSDGAQTRGEGGLPPGVVKLLLDGQQRITTLYGIIRGRPPRFFDGDARAFTGLHFHLESDEFSFYQPIKMKDDPLWVDVSDLMRSGNDGIGAYVERFSARPELAGAIPRYLGKLNRLLGIGDVDFHVDEVTGADKSVDVVVEIFNRVNSGGTKLSAGDLALAKICADWPDARETMKKALQRWREAGYDLDMDWLLRCVNTVVRGEAKFTHLHDVTADEMQDGIERAEKAIDTLLNLIAGRLGLDHDRVLFGRYALPVMVHYLDRRGGHLANHKERDRLLYWYVHAAMWGRFSGLTETHIDQDLEALNPVEGGIDRLIEKMRLWHGGLTIEPGHFSGWSRGARFYPLLYLLTRVGEARDWGTGLPLKADLLGKMSQLEMHHIFPKAILYKHEKGYDKTDVNAVANFCFLTKDTNLEILATPPEEYFPKIEEAHPGALASQWIPMDPHLWKLENYPDFLEERRRLLARAASESLLSLLHDDVPEALREATTPPVDSVVTKPAPPPRAAILGGIESEEEEQTLAELNEWVEEHGLAPGKLAYELVDEGTGTQRAVLDLAWPRGLQEGLSEPVAVLIGEPQEVLAIAGAHGFRYFTDAEAFRRYVVGEILHEESSEPAEATA